MLGLNNESASSKPATPLSWRPAGACACPICRPGFDALAWGIIGQQINVKFATSLRRELIDLAGEKVGDMRTHPTPERVANIDVASADCPALFPLQGAAI